MITVEITPDYFVTDDGTSFDLYKRSVYKSGKKTGDSRDDIVGYYSTMEGAIKKVIRLMLSETDGVCDLDKYLFMYKQLQEDLIKQQ